MHDDRTAATRDDGFGNRVPVDDGTRTADGARDDDGLSFDKVEGTTAEAAGGSACQACGRALDGEYYEVNATMVCAACAEEARQAMAPQGGRLGRFGRAALAGTGVAVVGSIVWYAIAKLTGYELGLVAIAIGWAVGSAVRWGSRHRGGWRYQTLAVLLTYLSIVSSYIPAIVEEMSKLDPAATAVVESEPAPAGALESSDDGEDAAEVPGGPVGAAPVHAEAASPAPEVSPFAAVLVTVVGLVVIAMAAPFFAGFQNILGLLIIAFGLWQAWSLNRRPQLEVSGPFVLSTRSSG